MKLVKLSNGDYVNPDHVTSIVYTGYETKIWVVGNSGYHTFSISFPGDRRDELSKIINT